jgi:prepilin-type processing-associated H-X9-DG protein
MVGSHESKPSLASNVVLNSDRWVKYGDGSIVNGASTETPCGSGTTGTLHSSGANYSFIDGHVKWFSQAQQGEMLCAIEQSSNPKKRTKRRNAMVRAIPLL